MKTTRVVCRKTVVSEERLEMLTIESIQALESAMAEAVPSGYDINSVEISVRVNMSCDREDHS